MEKVKILCLHGFLGLPTDWDFIKSHFMVSSLAHRFEWYPIDYMNAPLLGPQNNFQTWARNFNSVIQQQIPRGPRILVGYSLGGRLALHALQKNPELYNGAVFISTNPGLQKERDAHERWVNDQAWAQKFAEMPWSDVMYQWNQQAVFKDSVSEPLRFETHYKRPLLAQALTEWSLAKQPDFREIIAMHSSKIMWACGERDIKFASQGMDLKKRTPDLRLELLPLSSHRVLFDQPHELARRMIQFVEERI